MTAAWSLARACGVLEGDRRRVRGWQERAVTANARGSATGGHPFNGIIDWEEAAIIGLFNAWGPVDPSHRKLAHRRFNTIHHPPATHTASWAREVRSNLNTSSPRQATRGSSTRCRPLSRLAVDGRIASSLPESCV